MPNFSVIIPVFNAASTIHECLASLSNQTLQPSEIIIINDGSTDSTLKKISTFKRTSDISIRIIQNSNNSGICTSLNRGLEQAKTDWIARMDADDVCRSDRFEKQFEYIKRHRLSVCGSYIQCFNEDADLDIVTYPVTDTGIRNSMLFCCPLAHPTVIFSKRHLGNLKYDGKFEGIEDLALWINIATKDEIRFGNVPEPLLRYRVTETQYSKTVCNYTKALTLEKLRYQMAIQLRPKYNLSNGQGLIKYIKETHAEITDPLSRKRLKYFTLRCAQTCDLKISQRIRIIWYAGVLRFAWEKAKSSS